MEGREAFDLEETTYISVTMQGLGGVVCVLKSQLETSEDQGLEFCWERGSRGWRRKPALPGRG